MSPYLSSEFTVNVPLSQERICSVSDTVLTFIITMETFKDYNLMFLYLAVHILLQAAIFVPCMNSLRAKVDHMPKRGKKKERELILPIGAFTLHLQTAAPSACSLEINQVLNILSGPFIFSSKQLFFLPCEWPNGNNSRAIHTSKLLWGSGTRLLPQCEKYHYFPLYRLTQEVTGNIPSLRSLVTQHWVQISCTFSTFSLIFFSSNLA